MVRQATGISRDALGFIWLSLRIIRAAKPSRLASNVQHLRFTICVEAPFLFQTAPIQGFHINNGMYHLIK